MPSSPQQQPLPASVSVAVIGAGPAGLRTALTLQKKGVSVVVCEARDRVGGRLLSVPSPAAVDGDETLKPAGRRYDLGATWFWPEMEPLIDNLAKSSSTFELPPSGKQPGKKPTTLASGGECTGAVEGQCDGGGVTRPSLDAFEQHHEGAALGHAPGGRAQQYPWNPLDQPGTMRVAQGMMRFAEGLAASLAPGTLHLQTPVKTIKETKDTKGGVEVITAAGDVIVAQHVVLAVPPALAAERMVFDPPLPAEVAQLVASTPVWMGGITKVVAIFPGGPFWRAAGLAGSASSRSGPMNEIHDITSTGASSGLGEGAIFGFCMPRSASAKIEEVAVRQQVKELFGHLPNYVEPSQVLIKDWSVDEWTSPYPEVAKLDGNRGRTYGNPTFAKGHGPGGRIWFASTETSDSMPGHVEGALAAADRTAAKILAAMP